MRIQAMSRRDFSVGVASLVPVLASAKDAWEPGISRSAEAIHQVVTFQTTPKRIYSTPSSSAR